MRVFYRCTRWTGFLFYLLFSAFLFNSQKPVTATIVAPTRAKKAMVVSAHSLASEVGISMLRQGGHAVDAAVATAFAISVVEPFSAGIGGGGFLLLHEAKTGDIKALDFRERAPIKVAKNTYLDAQGNVRPNATIKGYLAVATPGTVAGLYEVHRRYGRLPWPQVIKPAITLARQGFILSPSNNWRSQLISKARQQSVLSNPAARAIFTHQGRFYQPGERLVQTDLARTLEVIARNPRDFYTGKIARTIASDMAKNGGLITLQDLKSYKPVWRTPVCGGFRQFEVCSMPPPSSGGVHLLQMLNIIGNTDFKTLGWNHPDALHLMVEAMKIAYADRSKYLGDPDFVEVPVAQLIHPTYAQIRRQEINLERARSASEVKPADPQILRRLSQTSPKKSVRSSLRSQRYESPETSHLTVVDAQRNAVSLTFTINLGFGSGVVVPGTGILLNNEMDDFAVAPGVPNAFGLVGSQANAIAPRKTPISSMTPTIVTQNRRLRLALGAPGGSTIITQVLQVLLNVLEYDMNVGAAVSVPRLHHQWLPDRLRVEYWGLDALTLRELQRRGHKIQPTTPWGNINAIAVTADNDLEGAADPRGEGSVYGF